jgi:predicted chitinase
VSQVDAPIVASDPGTELDSYQSLFKTWKDRNTATKAAKSSSKPKNAKDQIVGIDIGRQCSELLEKYTALEASQITGKSPEYVNRAAGAYWVYLNCIQVKDLIDSGKSTWGILYKASCANPEKKKLSITAKVIERS